MNPRPLELLAPARDLEVARQAILHGADAVYMGGPSHGARASACNSLDDIRIAVEFAHQYGAKLYVTLNTIIFDNELQAVERQVWNLWRAGVDALIVQDMGLLRMHLPPIDLHASTQCDIRTPQKAVFLAKCGFSQLVLPRELTKAEIEAMRQAVPPQVKLEAFVHGALCVSYSGDCQASCAANGRSANRGACAQMCRMAYDLIDAQGRVLVADKHLLSLRDLNRLADLPEMAEAGISSFKIEGRLKDADYVKITVTAYRKVIDKLIKENPEVYCRASYGQIQTTLNASVEQAFNRGFTPYFLHGKTGKMASFDSPKWIGQPVGKVKTIAGKAIIADLTTALNNGDGLGYFDAQGKFCGFRLNKIEGNKLFPATDVSLKPGTSLYRNSDAKLQQALSRETATRLIDVEMELAVCGSRLVLTLSAEQSRCTTTIDCQLDKAKSDQKEARQRTLGKLGGTIFRLSTLRDKIPADSFVPASVLTSLRRQGIELLQSTMRMSYVRQLRLPEDQEAIFSSPSLTYHDNVANGLARKFYLDHGVKEIQPAFEVQRPAGKAVVMTTRYCLRRELGACLREGSGRKLPSPLYLSNKAATYLLDFDCANCQMRLVATGEKPSVRNNL